VIKFKIAQTCKHTVTKRREDKVLYSTYHHSHLRVYRLVDELKAVRKQHMQYNERAAIQRDVKLCKT